MRSTHNIIAIAATVVTSFTYSALSAAGLPDLPPGTPSATIDLMTKEGVAMVSGQWRYSDIKIIEVDFNSPGPDRSTPGAPDKTYDFTPHAGGLDFDDSKWEAIDPTTLGNRRSTGKVCFNWYRINLTVPRMINGFDTNGCAVVFNTTVDDYAEIWVDGKLPRELGQNNTNLIQGWNRPNQLVVGRDVKPGQKILLAIFGINGPISDPPTNYIWFRVAKLEFYKSPQAFAPREVSTEIVRIDPAIDSIIPVNAKIEQLAEGFKFTEGPVWKRDANGDSLLFSDPNNNTIYQWKPTNQLAIFRDNSGYDGENIAEYHQPGSNGLTLDKQGRLTINQHGNRRVVRLENDLSLTTLADQYEDKRLNSPNDLVYKSDGALYFTDPPFGLPKAYDDPRKELPYCGVFRWFEGKLQLLTTDLKGPNGLAFSPDEKYFYVTNWDEQKKIVMRYDVKADGTLTNGRVFFDMTQAPGEEALDGMKIDRQGNLFVSGPGGVWIISPAGKHLGMIKGPELPANFAWGDDDGRTLYMTARTGLYRIRLINPGIRPE